MRKHKATPIMLIAMVCALMGMPDAVLAGEVGFAAKPNVSKTDEGATISFEVSEKTDVEVAILDAKGKIVRHLAAGMLGGEKAPPPPLAKGFAQKIEWDGKDDFGKPAADGPHKVRVRLGLEVKLDGFLAENDQWIGELRGLATDSKGNLYVHSSTVAQGEYASESPCMQVFDRSGTYLRTIMPMPANLPKEKLRAFNRTRVGRKDSIQDIPGDHFYPRNYCGNWPDFYPGGTAHLSPRPTPKDTLSIVSCTGLASIGFDGSAAGASFWRGLWPRNPNHYKVSRGYITIPSPDGKLIYLVGLCKGDVKGATFPVGRVYRMGTEQGRMEKFVDVAVAEKGHSFNGTALTGGDCDAQGNLLVGDWMADRVRVFDPEGKEIGGFAVENPEHVFIHRKTGKVYVVSVPVPGGRRQAAKRTLLKYSSWKKDATKLAEFELPALPVNVYKQAHWNSYAALDDSQEQAVIWFGHKRAFRSTKSGCLLRIEDQGDAFAKTADLAEPGNKAPLAVKTRLAVHPETEMLIYRDGGSTMEGIHGDTGKPFKVPARHASDLNVGLDGNWYIHVGGYRGVICRYDKDLKPIPVEGLEPSKARPANSLGGVYTRQGSGVCTMGVAGDRTGRAYSMQMYAWGPHCIAVFGPDGKPEDPGRLRDDEKMKKCPRFKSALVGPLHVTPGGLQLDYAGNIYVGMRLLPREHKPPAGFNRDSSYYHCVGSVVKFKPDGGGVIRLTGRGKPRKPPEGKAGFVARYCHVNYAGDIFLENATDIYPELGCHAGGIGGYCICRQPMFHVDGWGRILIPNAITCSVRMVDNTGNEILKFGHYGNVDSKGPSKDSLIKTPEVPLGWPEAVGASYKSIYIADVACRRIVRMKKVYAAEETCDIAAGRRSGP